MTKTAVVFRTVKSGAHKGTVIALFPYDVVGKYTCSSYEHVGQHSDADYSKVVQSTKRARLDEYKALKDELENQVGYDLKVLQKVNGQKQREIFQKFRTKRTKHF